MSDRTTEEKVEFILAHLGIREEVSETIIDELFSRIVALRDITEFNSMIIQELIKADIIPPTILKRVKLMKQIKERQRTLEKLETQFEAYKRIKAPERELNVIAQQMVKLQQEIEHLENEIKTFES